MKTLTLFPTSRLFAARMNRRALPLMMGGQVPICV